MQGYFCKYLTPWRYMAYHVGFRRLCGVFGTQMKHLTEFRDSDAEFESSGTQPKSRDKFGDLGCNLLL